MKVVRAQANTLGKVFEARHGLGFLYDAAGFGDFYGMLLDKPWLIGFATPARTKASLLCILAGRMKANVLWPRQTRRAGGTAIDTRRLNGIIESVVGLRVTGDDRRPTRIIYGRGGEPCIFR